jgi:hypothetical protein
LDFGARLGAAGDLGRVRRRLDRGAVGSAPMKLRQRWDWTTACAIIAWVLAIAFVLWKLRPA